jgi:hypothetical protein
VLQYIDYGDGQTGMSMNYQYTNAGVYTAIAYVANPQNTGIVFSCNTEITALNVPIDGVCNPNITDRLYYTGSMTLLANATQGLLCHT